MPIPQRIVQAARGWAGTRFHHQGRLKRTDSHRGGVDCLGLLVGVARELDLRDACGLPLARLDRTDYGHYPDGDALRRALAEAMAEKMPQDRCAGDVGLFRMDGNTQHLAIFTEAGAIVHAYAPARAVVETRFDAIWQKRLAAVFCPLEFEPPA